MGGANADQARARDITRQQADAIGYAARSSLLGGGIAVTTVHPSLAEARLVLFAPDTCDRFQRARAALTT